MSMVSRSAMAFIMAPLFAIFASPSALASDEDADSITYVVRKDDTLYHLSRLYLVPGDSLKQLRTVNHVRIAEQLPVGFKLQIPRKLLRFTPVELRLASFSGPVGIVIGGRQLAPAKGAVVAEGAQLQTGANGFVTLTGSDGSRISLPSNTRVRVNRSRHYLLIDASDIDFTIEQGRAEVRAAKQKPQA